MSIYGKNVVPIGISSTARSPGMRIVRECHDRLGHLIHDWLCTINQGIAEDLFALANDARDRLAQTRYLDLRAVILKSWSDFPLAFRQSFHKDQNSGSSLTMEISDFSGLELVDDDKLSENILVREFTARLSETCNEELYGLDHRMAALLEIEDVDKIDNPIGPSIVCQALADAALALCPEGEQRILLLRHVERLLHPVLPDIYREINRYLIETNVLPDLKRTYRRTTMQGQDGTAAPAASAGNQRSSLPIEGDVFSALQKLVAARALETQSMSPPTPAQPGVSPGTPLGSSGNIAMPIDAAALSQAFFASLENFRPEKNNSMVNQIHVIRTSEAVNQVSHLEAVTIDIVAMLFDFIFNDKNIPNGVKALVGRLQIPVLKVAMLDQSFFANRAHPARRFLDEISAICLRWGGNIDQQDPFFITLESLIERIQNEFECDIEIFSRALEELHAFVNQHDCEEEETVKVVADVAVRREREANAWEQANNAVRLASLETMPQVIADFFREQWVQVLQKIALAESKESPAWMDAIKLMSELAQSVVPKKKPEERMALISALPPMLLRINRGLDLINPEKSARRPFFDALVALHTAALKGEPLSQASAAAPVAKTQPAQSQATPPQTRIEQESSPATVADTSSPEGDLLITRSIANGVEVEEVTLVGAKPVWRADDRDVARQIAELKRGDWVEFVQEDGSSARERLTWISPQRHILVFSNHRAAKAISIAPDALARMVRENQARLVSEAPLFERAISGVLETLNAA